MTAGADPADIVAVPTHLLTVSVDDQLIVYDPVREQAHLLNHTAAAVWEVASSGPPDEDLTATVASRFTVDPAAIKDDVDRVLRDLVESGLLTPDVEQRPTSAAEPPTDAPTEPRPDASPGRETVEVVGPPDLRVRALDIEITISSAHQGVARLLTRSLGSLAIEPAEPVPPPIDRLAYQVALLPDSPDEQVVVTTHNEVVATSRRAAEAAATVLWHYNHEAIERTTRLLLLHSSAVATDDGVLALPAVANSGKSTLATALVRVGYRYVTDEALAIDPDTLVVEPYPKPIGLDPGSFPLFPDLEPTADELPPELFHDKWWLDPRRISPLGADAIAPPGLPLRAIVFPTYVADAAPSLEPVEPAEGVILLARNAFNLKRWSQLGLDLLAAIATTVPLYRMTHNDLATSLGMLGELIGPPPLS